jgi:hypothetical protein
MSITFNQHQTWLENPPFSKFFWWIFPRLAPDEIQQQLIRQKLGPYQAAAAYAAVAAKSVRLRSARTAKSDPSGILFKKIHGQFGQIFKHIIVRFFGMIGY